MTLIVDLSEYRRTRRIAPPLRMVQADDVRIEFARRVERQFFEQYESTMGGEKPCDSESAT